jgi:WD40 repeat protein/serine/threonine protein kinase
MVQDLPMSDVAAEHPTPEELQAFGLGRLDEDAGARVFAHLEQCDDCRLLVASMPDDTLSALVRASATPPDATDIVAASAIVVDAGEPDFLAGHPRYRVLGLVGVGGMGVVYQAQHLLMDRVVALKVIHRQLVEKPAAAERFRREVKAAARLAHPNIVTAHDADQVGDRHFLVMEYVPGVTLAQRVADQGPLSPAQACDYIRQAALGLQHAHERGMVHRDLKPHNLMLTPQGQVKILDFGLARLGQEPAGDLTESGTVMGSTDFLAPEQADDPHLADIRADLYSLGCTLFFLLTGRPPFPEGTLMQKLKAHALRKPPMLAAIRADLPAGLEQVVQRLLAKEPSRRFQNPAEVAEALAPFATLSRRPEKPTRRPRWRRLAVAASALCLLLASVIVYRVATDRGDIIIETDEPDVEVVVKQGEKVVTILDGKTKQKVTLNTGEYTLSLGSDADSLTMDLPPTFVLRRGDKHIVTIKRLPAGEITHWKAHDRQVILALDPTGKILASAGEDGKIRLWNVIDGKELRSWQAHTGMVLDLVFSPDGKTLASGSFDHTLKWWETQTGKQRRSVEAADPWFLRFTADGKSLFAGVNANGKGGTLRRVDLETQKDKDLANYDTFIFNVALGVDRRTLAISTDSKVRIWDTIDEKETLQFETANQQVNTVVFHPSGKLLAVGGDKPDLGLWDLSGNAKVTMAGLKQIVLRVAFSPDGKLLVSGGGSWRAPDGSGEIKVWDSATGKEVSPLGKVLSCVSRLVVTADGKTCFTGHFDGSIRKWRLPGAPNDHGQLEITSNDPDVQVVLEQNGKQVAVVDLLKRQSLRLMNEGEYTVKAQGKGGDVEVEPGRIVIKRGDKVTVTVKRGLVLAKLFEVPNQIGDVALSPDGKYALTGENSGRIILWDIAKGVEAARFEGHRRNVHDMTFTRDSKRFLSCSRDGTVRLWEVATGKEIRQYPGHAGEVWAARISRDDRFVLTGCHDKKIRLFDLETGHDKKVITDLEEVVHCVEFAPDGRRALSCADKTIRLWDLDKGQEIRS